ncbi:PAS domain S-box protein [Methanocalculus sp.]|uniref:PAS domain S-box protein n=1 Tax=Methanocalculus sp. TaxID=2004547 RepID=UPI0027166B3D|nr:PAS domain S-box protein [Methanocalculus sp.]MDO8841631.1 PAS domain S-box protein [Methanocalculus sp.]
MPSYPAEVTRITDLLRKGPRGMSVGEIADAIGINRNTAARYLDMLLVGGQVEMRTFGKAKVFFLSQRVPISAMLNISSDLVMVLDSYTRIILANDQILSFCKASREDTIGRDLEKTSLVIFSHPKLLEYMNDRNGKLGSTEVIRLLRRGEEHFFRQKIFPTVFDDGVPGVTVILEEITEQIAAEEALRQSEEMFRTLVSDISDVIWATDGTGAITYISPRSGPVCGSTPEEMIGRRFTDFMDPKEGERFRREIQPFIRREAAWPLVECNFKKPDGEVIAVELSATPITVPDVEGLPLFLGYRGAFRNVTERNRAIKQVRQWKRFLNSIVENIPDMVTVEELENHTLVFFNRASEEFIGVPRDFLVGKRPDRIFSEEYAALWMKTSRDVERSGETLDLIRQIVSGEGKEEKTLRTKKIPIFSSNGKMRYILGIITDITEEKRAADRILRERNLALRFEEAGTFQEASTHCLEAMLTLTGMETGGIYRQNGGGELKRIALLGEELIPLKFHTSALINTEGEAYFFEKEIPEAFKGDLSSLVLIPVTPDEGRGLCILLASQKNLRIPAHIREGLQSLIALTKTGFSRLIAEERLKEERDLANSYLQLAGVLIAVIGTDGRIEMINRKGCTTLGYREEELIGADWFETVVPEEIQDGLHIRFNRLIELGIEPSESETSPIIDRSGRLRQIRWHNTLIRNREGVITAVVSAGEEEEPQEHIYSEEATSHQ